MLMNQNNRKLAAIVFTDIVGFTKLSSEDQTTASELLKKQRELFQPIVKQFNGDLSRVITFLHTFKDVLKIPNHLNTFSLYL